MTKYISKVAIPLLKDESKSIIVANNSFDLSTNIKIDTLNHIIEENLMINIKDHTKCKHIKFKKVILLLKLLTQGIKEEKIYERRYKKYGFKQYGNHS